MLSSLFCLQQYNTCKQESVQVPQPPLHEAWELCWTDADHCILSSQSEKHWCSFVFFVAFFSCCVLCLFLIFFWFLLDMYWCSLVIQLTKPVLCTFGLGLLPWSWFWPAIWSLQGQWWDALVSRLPIEIQGLPITVSVVSALFIWLHSLVYA